MSFNFHDINVGDIVEVTHRGEVTSRSVENESFVLTSEQQDPGCFATLVAFYTGDHIFKDVSVVGRRKPRVGDVIGGDAVDELPLGSVVISQETRNPSPRVKLRNGWRLTADGHEIGMPPRYNFRVLFIPEQKQAA